MADDFLGIISACAERTSQKTFMLSVLWDHLRVCGADPKPLPHSLAGQGSSPRVRSGQEAQSKHVHFLGIISACAERTCTDVSPTCSPRDHLRVCGADRDDLTRNRANVGSSPRVRSGQVGRRGRAIPRRIISACAERTSAHPVSHGADGDHLRVCGADGLSLKRGTPRRGSSPRVRSGPYVCTVHLPGWGIISACAERTEPNQPDGKPARDHLRVCGADSAHCPAPRAITWIISACAERTRQSDSDAQPVGDHLRVCGADRSLARRCAW